MATTEEREITFYGNDYCAPGGCPGCDRIDPQPKGLETILTVGPVSVHQDYETPIPHFWIIQVDGIRGHKRYKNELRNDLHAVMDVAQKLETALRDGDGFGIEQIIDFQQNKSGHFHYCVLPEFPWMKEKIPDYHQRNIQNTMQWAKDNLTTPKGIADVEEATREMKSFLNV